jgi:hypothetical protein
LDDGPVFDARTHLLVDRCCPGTDADFKIDFAGLINLDAGDFIL